MICTVCGTYEQGSFTVAIPEQYRSWDFCSDVCLERLKEEIEKILPEAKRKAKTRKQRRKK